MVIIALNWSNSWSAMSLRTGLEEHDNDGNMHGNNGVQYVD